MIGTLGPHNPSFVTYRIPQAGQQGYHRRTQFNMRVLRVVKDPRTDPITPTGGFPHYGEVRTACILLHGSVPGPAKRLLRFRTPIRSQIAFGREGRHPLPQHALEAGSLMTPESTAGPAAPPEPTSLHHRVHLVGLDGKHRTTTVTLPLAFSSPLRPDLIQPGGHRCPVPPPPAVRDLSHRRAATLGRVVGERKGGLPDARA